MQYSELEERDDYPRTTRESGLTRQGRSLSQPYRTVSTVQTPLGTMVVVVDLY